MTGDPISRLLALMRPRPAAVQDGAGTIAPRAPPGSDWAWRPGAFGLRVVPGHRLGDGLALFHDCPALDLALTLIDRTGVPDAPAHAFGIEVGQFTGSYLSVVTDLPATFARSLTRQHILGVRAQVTLSGPTEVYLRLNLRHGPNTDAQVRRADMGGKDGTDLRSDFDLASLAFDPERMTAAWLDLIVSRPERLRIELRDIVLSRRLRAAL
jgi:hypothetical protein